MFLKRFIDQLALLMLSPRCVLCGYLCQNHHNLCLRCLQKLPILSHCCRQCAQILPASSAIDTTTMACGACLIAPPPFERCFALFSYEEPIPYLVALLKFRHELAVAQALYHLFSSQIKEHWYRNDSLPDLILPIPLHPKRLQERGFNQALEIAKPLSKALHLPLDISGVHRIKHTAPQSSLPAHERKANLHGAFTCQRDYSGLTIALLDDVITTSNTVQSCSETLKQAGAKQIHVWCIARAMLADRVKTR